MKSKGPKPSRAGEWELLLQGRDKQPHGPSGGPHHLMAHGSLLWPLGISLYDQRPDHVAVNVCKRSLYFMVLSFATCWPIIMM